MAAIETSSFPDTCDCHQWSKGEGAVKLAAECINKKKS